MRQHLEKSRCCFVLYVKSEIVQVMLDKISKIVRINSSKKFEIVQIIAGKTCKIVQVMILT